MRKITFILSLALLMTFSVQAQFPTAGNVKPGQQPPSIGHIYGKITDSSGASISDVSVLLLQTKMDTVTKKRKEVLLKGITTKSNGEFSFSELPIFGQLKLKISSTGYKPYEQAVSFQMKMDPASAPKAAGNDPSQAMASMSGMMNSFDKDLGNIKLEVDAQQ